MPFIPNSFVDVVTNRYIELYEVITGKRFKKYDTFNIEERIQKNVDNYLQTL